MLMFGGCVVVAAVVPCSFDPPPGDVSSVEVINDSAVAVAVLNCYDETCHRSFDAQVLRSDESTDVNVESCSGATFGVTDPHTMIVQGCIAIPGGEPFTISKVMVSQSSRCKGSTSTPQRAREDKPG